MRVLVTGARGFVGQRLIPRLEREGHAVTAHDLDVDITNAEAIAGAVEAAGPDAIIHLAAVSSVAVSLRDPSITYRVNYLGTHNLLAAMQRHAPGARLLLIGSGDQYAPTAPGDPPRRESDPLCPRSPYARSKAAAEQLASLASERGLSVVRIRAFNHTGAGQEPGFVAPDFASQIAGIAAGRRAPEMRVGNLDSVRDFMHVDDVLDAYIRLLSSDVPATLYNVASGEGTSIRTILDTLCELADVHPRVETDPKRYRPADAMVGDASRLRDATGWKPTIALRDTLQELLDYWRSVDA
jgi:GDP-4-dehydro-6-deoxy-D-mannose reductase